MTLLTIVSVSVMAFVSFFVNYFISRKVARRWFAKELEKTKRAHRLRLQRAENDSFNKGWNAGRDYAERGGTEFR